MVRRAPKDHAGPLPIGTFMRNDEGTCYQVVPRENGTGFWKECGTNYKGEVVECPLHCSGVGVAPGGKRRIGELKREREVSEAPAPKRQRRSSSTKRSTSVPKKASSPRKKTAGTKRTGGRKKTTTPRKVTTKRATSPKKSSSSRKSVEMSPSQLKSARSDVLMQLFVVADVRETRSFMGKAFKLTDLRKAIEKMVPPKNKFDLVRGWKLYKYTLKIKNNGLARVLITWTFKTTEGERSIDQASERAFYSAVRRMSASWRAQVPLKDGGVAKIKLTPSMA